MSKEALSDYFEALERLKKRRAKISNDAVAIEASRKKGSIKKSRPTFAQLISAINAAAVEHSAPGNEQKERLIRAKQNAENLREQLDASHARELSLLAELFDLRKRLAKLTNDKVLPIRGAERKIHG
jgi:hypothetical protein